MKRLKKRRSRSAGEVMTLGIVLNLRVEVRDVGGGEIGIGWLKSGIGGEWYEA